MEWIEVKVQIPADAAGEFYSLVGEWLESQKERLSAVPSSVTWEAQESSPRRVEPWRNGTEEARLRDAATLYRRISPLARHILNYWIDRPGQRVLAQRMAGDLELDSVRTVAGSLSSFTKQDVRAGSRGLPFFWEETREGTVYWMDEDIATLFGQARTIVQGVNT